jgi:hypothetical protein
VTVEDEFMRLAESLRALSPEDRQKVIDIGKDHRSPTVRLFFSEVEKNLREIGGQLPPSENR